VHGRPILEQEAVLAHITGGCVRPRCAVQRGPPNPARLERSDRAVPGFPQDLLLDGRTWVEGSSEPVWGTGVGHTRLKV